MPTAADPGPAARGGIGIRRLAEGEEEAFARCFELAFSAAPTAAHTERARLGLEPGRTLVAVDGDEVVGTCALLSLEMTVPGGFLPVAGVSGVGVLPSHRRRGTLTHLIQRQLQDLHAGGEAVAALFASQAGIYGRFGFGMAGDDCAVRIATRDAELRALPAAPGRMRIVHDPAASLAQLGGTYDRCRTGRPGMIRREERQWRSWWAELVADDPRPVLLAVHEREGVVDGYVLYRVELRWAQGQPSGLLQVQELIGDAPAVEAALWQYLLGIDLVSEVETWHRPPDDVLRWCLADLRSLNLTLRDGLWVRLVDGARALEGRGYGAEGELVFDLDDSGCPWNRGRYHLEVGPGGARCRRTRRSAQLHLDVAALGSAYLGAARLVQQARAGRVEESEPGAAARADRLLSWPIAPWCAEVF